MTGALPLELEVSKPDMNIGLSKILVSPYWIALPDEVLKIIGADIRFYNVGPLGGIGTPTEIFDYGALEVSYGDVQVPARVVCSGTSRLHVSPSLAELLHIPEGEHRKVKIDKYRSGPPFG